MKQCPNPRITLAMRISSAAFAVPLFAPVFASSQTNSYPKPQIASAVDQPEPEFTLKDQDGKDFKLSDQHGHWVLLFFYRGYWWPYCMTELREFARHSDDLAKLDVQLVPISVDDQQHAREAWEKAAAKEFRILSDPGAAVIKKYGLLHAHGGDAGDIALRTTILIGPDGREHWRRVSKSVPDIPSWKETLTQIKAAQTSADAKHWKSSFSEFLGSHFQIGREASEVKQVSERINEPSCLRL